MKASGLIKSGLILFGLVASGTVWASCSDPSPFPANNRTICEGSPYFGVFSEEAGTPSINTCVVTGSGATVIQAVAPGCNQESFAAGFEAAFDTNSTTTYTKGTTCTTTQVTNSTLVECFNNQGKSISLSPCTCN